MDNVSVFSQNTRRPAIINTSHILEFDYIFNSWSKQQRDNYRMQKYLSSKNEAVRCGWTPSYSLSIVIGQTTDQIGRQARQNYES